MASGTIISVLVVYLAILLAIGAWGARDSRSLAGYYLAGKRLPAWVIAFSSNATGESGWLLLGLTGMGYVVGVHAFWVVLGEVLGVALAWAFVALPFKRYTDRYGSITVADYLASRFRDSTHALRVVSTIIICTMVTVYTAAQFTASGKAFDAFLGTGYTGGVLIGAAVIFYYTTVGGFKAVAYSDLLQGVLMLGGLFVLPLVGVAAAGGWTSMIATLRAADPSLLEPMGAFGWSTGGVISAASFAGIGLAFLGTPQLLTRFMAARSEDEIVSGSLLAVLCIIVFDVGAVLTGMAGRTLMPGLADPETILPVMSADLLPAVVTGVFLVIVLAAIMSTADSLLILASSAVVRDVVQQVFRPDLDDRRLARYGKVTTVIIGLGALGFALTEARLIFWFVLFAWSGLASAFTPVVVCSLFWKRTTRVGALAGMIAGFLAAVVWVVAFKSRFHDLYEMWPGFIAGFGVTIAVSLFTRPPDCSVDDTPGSLSE
ncbi:MAG: sodium/proline symporter [Vicinamibacterales bacterium]|jgi:sodium/proline symporter|nr:sodium:proline symporter [Acidobacteriota bacterium]MDP6372078.1 sodium/proline symporter [Vicinamibacterales bacterium]MDP6608794.1 sodium/proline symporter [Vicinamibacterales bacterium]